MNNAERTCLDDMENSRIRGREKDIFKQIYMENGILEEYIDNTIKLLDEIEL